MIAPIPVTRLPRPDPLDQIAAEAARIYDAGGAATLHEAIHAAVDALDLPPNRRPGVGRVRRHLQARAMQTLGDEGYRRLVVETLTVAEELMTALSEMADGMHPILVGRAARELVDGPGRLHVRVYTDATIERLARTLVDLGYDEPEFQTVDTRHGRMNRLLLESDGVELAVTRVATRLLRDVGRDLFADRPIAHLDVAGVRALTA